MPRIPFEIRIEGWTKRQLIDCTGYQLLHADGCRERADEAGAVEAERRCDLHCQEIDRSEQTKARREARRLARLRANAHALRAVHS